MWFMGILLTMMAVGDMPTQAQSDDLCLEETVLASVEDFYIDFLGERPVAPFMAGDNLGARLRGLAARCGDDSVLYAQFTLFQPTVTDSARHAALSIAHRVALPFIRVVPDFDIAT